ncbi:MAG: hypothetical protein JRE45_14085, partial [Deltaproteobacteria bacterium]|nr:hypothetical protein [Deltaproteobacteria bacterium]
GGGGGTGGDGGTGGGGAGGDGGTGGGGGTGPAFCAEWCDDQSAAAIARCEDAFHVCIDNPPSGPNPEEKCTVIAILECHD